MDNESDFEYVLNLQKIETDLEDYLIVAGTATTETMDHDEEIVDLESVRGVWKDYMANPVVRYFHGKDKRNPDAVGMVIPEHIDSNGKTWKTEMTENGPFIVAKISNAPDTESIRKKIAEGIIKGFSIGGRAKRVKEYSHALGKDINRVITNRISEISVVDLPANPDSFFNVLKSSCIGDQCKIKSEEMDGKEIEIEEIQTKDVEKAEDKRPPSTWWDNCMNTAQNAEGIENPEKFCGWMWAHGRGSGFAMQREAIGKGSNEIDNDLIKSVNDLMLIEDDIEKLEQENDDLRKQIDELQSHTRSDSEEVVMKHTNTGGKNMAEQDENIVRFEPTELKDFIKSTMDQYAEDSAILEKADDYDRLLSEMKDLRSKIEGLEAKVKSQAAALKASPQAAMKSEATDEIEDADDAEKAETESDDVQKMDALEVRLKAVEDSPLYKATQDGEDMDEKDKKKTKKGHLANIIGESFGTGGK